jgi:hypothetical protein
MLKFLNPWYYNITITSDVDVRRTVSGLRDSLIEQRQPMPYRSAAAEAEAARATSDITNPERDIPAPAPNGDPLVDMRPHPEPEPSTVVGLSERFPMSGSSTTPPLQAVADSLGLPRLVLPRGSEPFNNYLQNQEIVYCSFPTVFPLGSGCGMANGPLTTRMARYLLKFFTRVAARNQRLLHTLHNIKMRADAGRVVAACVRTDAAPLQRFLNIVQAPDFEARLAYALYHPDSAEAHALLRELTPAIVLPASRIPFSPYERGTAALVELVAFIRYYGLANVFLTIGLDETRMCLVARIAQAPPRPGAGASSCGTDFWGGSQTLPEYAECLPGDWPLWLRVLKYGGKMSEILSPQIRRLWRLQHSA